MGVAQILDLPAILLEVGQAAVGIEVQAAFAIGRGKTANPPDQMRDRQLPAELFFQQGLWRRRFIASLVGDFQRHPARATGQARRAATQWAGQAYVVVVLTL